MSCCGKEKVRERREPVLATVVEAPTAEEEAQQERVIRQRHPYTPWALRPHPITNPSTSQETRYGLIVWNRVDPEVVEYHQTVQQQQRDVEGYGEGYSYQRRGTR